MGRVEARAPRRRQWRRHKVTLAPFPPLPPRCIRVPAAGPAAPAHSRAQPVGPEERQPQRVSAGRGIRPHRRCRGPLTLSLSPQRLRIVAPGTPPACRDVRLRQARRFARPGEWVAPGPAGGLARSSPPPAPPRGGGSAVGRPSRAGPVGRGEAGASRARGRGLLPASLVGPLAEVRSARGGRGAAGPGALL